MRLAISESIMVQYGVVIPLKAAGQSLTSTLFELLYTISYYMKTISTVIAIAISTFLLYSCTSISSQLIQIEGYNYSGYDIWISHTMAFYINPSEDWQYIGTEKHRGERVIYKDIEFVQVKNMSHAIIFEDLTRTGLLVDGLQYMKKRLYPNGICFQIWEDELIQKVGWDDFIQNFGDKYKYILEYEIDVDDLPTLNYEIKYPPLGAIEELAVIRCPE